MATKIEAIKTQAIQHVDGIASKLREVSLAIHAYAEPPFQEYKSSELLTSVLREDGFAVEKPIAGLETAFRATFGKAGTTPQIFFTAEYDAIRVLEYKSQRIAGHACGHNLNATASVGAALTVKKFLSTVPGVVVVIGTPAEEELGRGGKLTLLREGVFQDADAAMMMHGTLYRSAENNYFTAPHSTSHLKSLIVSFKGSRLAAATINALDSLHLFLQGLYALDRRFSPEVRIERIILRGGETPNAIPVEAIAKVWVRCKIESLLNSAVSAVRQCAAGSASAMGAECEIDDEGTIKSVRCNSVLERLAGDNAKRLGLKWKNDAPLSPFSTDFGNLSQEIPSLYLKVPLGPGRFHNAEAIVSSKSEGAHESMINAVKLLSLTAIDVLVTPDLLLTARNELNYGRATDS
jgi:amidohydrolase